MPIYLPGRKSERRINRKGGLRQDGSFEWLEQSSYDESDILKGIS